MMRWKISSAVRISAFYFIAGILWIFFSDKVLALLIPDIEHLSSVQTYKGWFFILITTLLLLSILKINEETEKKTQRAAEEQYQELVEGLPGVVFMDNFNDPQSSHYLSPRLEDLLGYTPQEWIVGDNLWEQSLHPDDKERVIAEDVHTNLTGEPFRIEYRIRHRDGHYIWVKEDASIIKDAAGNPKFWQGILLDITEKKTVEEALQRRDGILKAVGFSAEQFLKSSGWEESVEQVLERLGRTTEVSRVYIYKNCIDAGQENLLARVHEWHREGVASQIDNPNLKKIDLVTIGCARWLDIFRSGQSLKGLVNDFPSAEQTWLRQQGIQSLVCIPIQAGNQWWGFIGFDDCQTGHEWTETDVEALRAAARTLGIAIEKEKSVQALKESETSYRGLFNTVRDAIYIQDREGRFLDVNEGAAQMYGYPKEHFLGKTPDFIAATGRNDHVKISKSIERAFSGIPQEFEFWGVRSNGEIFPKDVRLFRGTYFGKEAIIALAQDITARKQYEEALQKQLRELSVLHLAAMTESTARNVDELIQQVTDIISDSLYSDNCGVLLLNDKQDTLTPHYSYRGIDLQHIFEYLPITQGVYGKSIAARHSFRVGDVSFEPAYYEISPSTRSQLCVPIISGTNTYGVLNVESKMPNAFTESDERLLNTIAGGLANTMERIQLFELERKRFDQAEFLRKATLELTAYFEINTLFEKIFILLEQLIKFDSASIEMMHQDFFEIVAGKNIPQELIGQRYPSDIEKWGGLEVLREPIIVSDIEKDERFIRFDQTSYIRSWMGVSFLAQDRLIGFLNIDSRFLNFFNAEQAATVQTFANQAAIAIENARLFELEQRRRQEAELLSLATSSLANTLDTDDLHEKILDWLQKLVSYDSASIMLKDENIIRLTAHRHLPENFQIGQEFPITPKWKKIAESRAPLIIEDVQKDDVFEKWAGSEYIHGWMAIAMFAQDALIGFINLDSRTPGTFTDGHAILLQTFANQAATAIEKARLFELEKKRRKMAETVRLATTAITNLLNLPALYTSILEWLSKITPYDSASILEIEGDHLKLTAERGLPNAEPAQEKTYPLEYKLCRVMSETGQALIIEDCWTDPRVENWDNAQHVRGWLGVPLISRGQIIGFITIESKKPNAFSQNDAIAAQTFAQQAAASLENVRLYTETSRRLEELEMVSRVSFALRAAQDTGEMFPILLNELRSIIDTEEMGVWLFEKEKSLLLPGATSGQFRQLPKQTFLPSEGIVGKVFITGEPHLSLEYSSDLDTTPENAKFIGPGTTCFAVPIQTTSEIIGVLVVSVQAPRTFELHYQRLITTIAEIAGNAIYRSNLFERSEEQIRRLTTLREIDTAITSSLDLHITLNIILEHLISKMGVSAASFLVFNKENQMLDYYARLGFHSTENFRTSISMGDGLVSQILLDRKPVYIKDLREEPVDFQSPPFAEEYATYYAIPLFIKGAARGILEMYFRHTFSLSADWLDFAQTLAGQAAIAIDNAQLFENLQRSNQELSIAYDTTLEGWGKALELRDKETQGHTWRVTNLTVELARQMGLSESDLVHIRRGTLLHDIGKMGVPDHILHKPGPLTSEELAEMRKHPQYAYDLLSPIPYLRPALGIAYYHHEWWDGSGYPHGMKGENIPLPARIFAIVDVWDALLSDRPYRKAWTEEKVMEYIHQLSGKQFDPQVVEAFKKMLKDNPKFVRSNLPHSQ